MSAAAEEGDIIDEDPIEVREFERVLAPYLSRQHRRRFWHALTDAGLIVFHGERSS